MAVLAALGLFDANDLLRLVDMLDLQPDHFAGAQAAAVTETKQHADLEAAGDCQQTLVSSGLITSGIFLRLTDVNSCRPQVPAAAASRETRTAARS